MKLKIPIFDHITNTNVRSLWIFQTTFEINKFEKWPHPVGSNTKMHFHVSLGFHGTSTKGIKADGEVIKTA